MVEATPAVDPLLDRAAAGDVAAWGVLLTLHQERLRRMVAFRLDPPLLGRVDASDVVQEAYLQATAHRDDYFRQRSLPLFLWLRGVTNAEAARVLEIQERAAAKRYVRALKRLKDVLADMPGGLTELKP